MNLEISIQSHIKLVSDGRQVTRRKWSQNTQVQPNPYGSCFVQSGDDFISMVIPSNKLVLIAIKEWGNCGKRRNMSAMNKAGDWAFKALVGGLSVATVYLSATFSVNVYRGFAWHKAQAKMEETDASDQTA